MERLAGDVPAEPAARSAEQQARWLLANLLEWHRREDKATWWEFFRLRRLSDEELLDEKHGLGGLEFVSERRRHGQGARPPLPLPGAGPRGASRGRAPRRRGGRARARSRHRRRRLHGRREEARRRARRPPDVGLRPRADPLEAHPRGPRAPRRRRRRARHRTRTAPTAPPATCSSRRAAAPAPAGALAPLVGTAKTLVDAADAPRSALDRGVLPIQGPPGAGKTYTGARMIVALVAAPASKVGVTAVSHKVIRNLLDEALEAAREEAARRSAASRRPTRAQAPPRRPASRRTTNEGLDRRAHDGSAHVGGGTAWLWARDGRRRHPSTSSSSTRPASSPSPTSLAAAQAAQNVVLLGDPQQLEQPHAGHAPRGRATPPPSSTSSAATRPCHRDRGLFLDETWRLHPPSAPSRPSSSTRAASHRGPRLATGQKLVRAPRRSRAQASGSCPSSTTATRTRRAEEVEAVAALVAELSCARASLDRRRRASESRVDPERHPRRRPLQRAGHRLHEAPARRRARRHRRQVPGPGGAGRHLLDGHVIGRRTRRAAWSSSTACNRLNVATSRARCACILVASPRLFEPDCQTPRQMRLANALCRFGEMASQSSFP